MNDTPSPSPARGAPASRGASVPQPRPSPSRTARDYWNMFRERGHWGLLAALLVGGATAWWQFREPAVYRAWTTIEIQNPPPAIDSRGALAAYPAPREVNLAYHMERIRSASFRSYVVHSFTPQEAEKIRQSYLDRDLPVQEQASVDSILAASVEVAERPGSPILEIAARHRDAQAAEIVANRYARRYIDYSKDQAANSTSGASLLLDEEEGRLRQQLEAAQGRLQEFRAQNDTVALRENQAIVRQRLESTGGQLIEARGERTRLESVLTQIEALQAAGRSPVEVSYVSAFDAVAVLLRDIDQLKAERAVLDERYLERHPTMVANSRAIEAKTQLLAENIDRVVAELRHSMERAREHERLLSEQEARFEQEAHALEQVAAGHDVLQKEAAGIVSQLYDEIPRRRKELVLASGLTGVNIVPLDKAVAPTLPVSPEIRHVALVSGSVAFVVLLVVPLAFGIVDVRLKAAWEVEQFLGQNLLGEIPAIAGVHKKDRPHLMSKEMDHAASEAFRGLFGQYQLNSAVPYPKVVMITSTLPGEGKSMVANNLAATFAAHGKRVLLVDCDLRRPNLHLYYGRDNGFGVLRWMDSGLPVKDPALSDEELGILEVKDNLFLLRSGGEHRRATELFELAEFTGLLATLRRQFDIVLVDTPPLGVFPDGLLISKLCDEVVYVCRFNAVHRSKIRKTLERLRNSAAVIGGIILNAIPTGKQSAYYDYYGYGSSENKRYKAYYAQKR